MFPHSSPLFHLTDELVTEAPLKSKMSKIIPDSFCFASLTLSSKTRLPLDGMCLL
jgi:hypothetical protein